MVNKFQLLLSSIILQITNAYCPIVICPGFGNDAIDYKAPLEQDEEVGLISVLGRRGFDTEKIYTVPIQRSDWINVARGLFDIPGFYTGNASADGLGYGWYLKRLRETVDLAHEESGGERVLLLAHSAGGWLARAALGDGSWCETRELKTGEVVRGLVTMGAIHRVPEDASTCVTRGALKNTDLEFPGAFLAEDGVRYFSVGGASVEGDVDSESKASRVAFGGYKAVSGDGNRMGDGVVPFDWTQLEGAKQIRLDGVFHSINEAGTTNPTNNWYGGEDVIDRWLDTVMTDLELGDASTGSGSDNVIAEFFSNLFKPTEDVSR